MRRSIFIVAILIAGCQQKAADPAANAAAPVSEVTAPRGFAASPSFDCARADGQAQELVCSDPALGAMDRELSRLFALAEADKMLPADGLATLRANQRGWIKGRDDCWKADELRQCVMTSYAQRIHELRQGSKAARAEASESLSIGPLAYFCDGIDAGIGVTFVKSDPGVLYMEWTDHSMALNQVESASGARYTGQWDGKPWQFWIKGREATFSVPGTGDLACREEEIG
ncbi:MAG: MliC family protein [Sphingomicrobium sp.]